MNPLYKKHPLLAGVLYVVVFSLFGYGFAGVEGAKKAGSLAIIIAILFVSLLFFWRFLVKRIELAMKIDQLYDRYNKYISIVVVVAFIVAVFLGFI